MASMLCIDVVANSLLDKAMLAMQGLMLVGLGFVVGWYSRR